MNLIKALASQNQLIHIMNKSALSTHSHTIFCEIDSHLKSPKIEEKKISYFFYEIGRVYGIQS